jgi:hypothetical protein
MRGTEPQGAIASPTSLATIRLWPAIGAMRYRTQFVTVKLFVGQRAHHVSLAGIDELAAGAVTGWQQQPRDGAPSPQRRAT